MNLERITENNINDAVSIQEELFPQASARTNYEEFLDPSSGFEYYLIRNEGACIGVIGIYQYPDDPDSAWLGWFGIRDAYRRKHFGSAALKKFEQMAVEKGYHFARLYTDALDNDAAIAFYQANGYISEPYDNQQDPACMKYKILIFTKPLAHNELVLWNSRTIHLTEQIAKQRKQRGLSGSISQA
jgi:RimJ/RimL family protein N-acetyltransferase